MAFAYLKIRSEDYLLLPLYINRSIAKNLLIEKLLEMIDSSIENCGEVEYDIQNCLRHQKFQIRPLVVNCVEVHKIYWKRRHRRVRIAHELNRLGLQGRAQAPLAAGG